MPTASWAKAFVRACCGCCRHAVRHSAARTDADVANPQDKEHLDATLWYYAKVEGPFSWEQMRHWHEAGSLRQSRIQHLRQLATLRDYFTGYFKNARLLVRTKAEGSQWSLLDDTFPDAKTAFLPAEALEEAQQIGAEPEAIGNILEEVDENQLLPEELKAAEENMTRYFQQGDNWFFIDAEGETQGPFPGKSMTSWYKSRYFWNKTLLIGHFGWDAFCTLEEVMAQAAEIDWDEYEAEQAAADDGAASPQAADDQAEYSAAQSPEPAADAGAGGDAEDVAGGAHEEPEDDEGGDAVVDSSQWQYIDESGSEQGPFAGSDMRAWFAYEYFDAQTRVKLPHWDEYIPVSALFAPGAEFASGSPAEWDAAYSVVQGTAAASSPAKQAASPPAAPQEAALPADDDFDDPAEALWYYVDEQGESQGPFSAADMKSWCEWGYFGGSTQVARSGWGAYVPANTVFPADALFAPELLGQARMQAAYESAAEA